MPKLLFVDDENSWRELCRHEFESMGYEVEVSGSGDQGLQMAITLPPDVIVVDLCMPTSGRSLLEILKRELPEVPVIVHTAYSGYSGTPGLARANAVVTKQADLAPLKSQISKLLAPTA